MNELGTLVKKLNDQTDKLNTLQKSFQRSPYEEAMLLAGKSLNAKESQENFYSNVEVLTNFDGRNYQAYNGQAMVSGNSFLDSLDFSFSFVPRKIKICVSYQSSDGIDLAYVGVQFTNTSLNNYRDESDSGFNIWENDRWTKEIVIPKKNTMRYTGAGTNNISLYHELEQKISYKHVRIVCTYTNSLRAFAPSLRGIFPAQSQGFLYQAKVDTATGQRSPALWVQLIGMQ